MLNQKDNDFDDLFRRASDKYPLQADSADWDRMAAALDDPSAAFPETQDTDKRRKRRFIWFFLLLPLVGVGYYALHHYALLGAGHGQTVATAPASSVQAPVSGSGTSESGESGSGTSGAGANESGTSAAGANESETNGAGAGSGTVGAGTSANGTGASNGGKGAGANGAGTGDAGKGAGANGAGTNGGATAVTPGEKNIVGGNNHRGQNHRGQNGAGGIKDVTSAEAAGGATSGKVRASKDRKTGVSKDRVAGVSKDRVAGGAGDGMAGETGGAGAIGSRGGLVGGGSGGGNVMSAVDSRVANYPVGRAFISKDYNLTVNVVAPVIAKDSSKVKPKASSKQKSSYLYAGILAAPDLSTVKFQSTKGVGTTYSLLLGYQFNKRWAIESGVSLDRKKYYTSGEYFDTKDVHFLYNGATLNNVDGSCYMWEVPVNLRYNFSQTERTRWFATVGLSTYFMTREKYTYNYTVSTWTADSNWDIKKPSQYWFSIINLSAGYEHRLGGIGNLRIEPYLRIPLAGVGTGKLNILSTGINIGITRRLW